MRQVRLESKMSGTEQCTLNLTAVRQAQTPFNRKLQRGDLCTPVALLALSAVLSTAQAKIPASLTGIWQPTGVSASARATPNLPVGQLVFGNSVRGQVGCGTCTGQVQATAHTVHLSLNPDAPAPGVRCLYALPAPVLSSLNAATHDLISSDTQRLMLFNSSARLSFVRLDHVTPANKWPGHQRGKRVRRVKGASTCVHTAGAE